MATILADLNQNSNSLPQFEDVPLTRAEYVAVMTHFYRAEMHRATVWRLRLDTTTNWSIISVMGLISFAMANEERSQLGIIVGMMLVFTFLVIEARRFRFFDVWRSRVRMLELNFVGPVLLRSQISPVKEWSKKVAEDLLHPRYKLTWHQALRIRLVRNYFPMFGLLFACWIIKLDSFYFSRHRDHLLEALWEPLEFGAIPLWVSMTVVIAFYLYLLAVACFVKSTGISESDFWKEDLREVRDFDS